MPIGEDARKALKAAIDRQRATREATEKVASDIATRKADEEAQTSSEEVTR